MDFLRPTLLIFPALCATATLSSCSRPPAPAEIAAQPALTVELVSPTVAEWPDRIEAHGSIAPWQESIVGAEVGDLRLEEVLVNVGDVVTKGELLVRFNTDKLAADLAVAEADVAQAEALATRAADKAARARRLGNKGGLSEEDLRQNEADEKASLARLAAARAQLRLQQLQLLHTEVRAPDDGVISSRSATVGAVLNPGAELFRLIRQRRLEWRALVPADQLSRVARGQTATLAAAGKPTVTAIVRQVSPVVDSSTLSAMVYVDLPQPAWLRAGMFVSGAVLFPGHARAPRAGVGVGFSRWLPILDEDRCDKPRAADQSHDGSAVRIGGRGIGRCRDGGGSRRPDGR
jgi:RND family efflux transporter MFP subunit